MKLTNTQWIIVAALGAVAVWYFFLRKKDTKKESGFRGGGLVPVLSPADECAWNFIQQYPGIKFSDAQRICSNRGKRCPPSC